MTGVSGDGYPDKSRSQKKRESAADQQLGERLAALAPAQLPAFGLAPDLEQAILEWKDLKTHEAKRRQMQFIGRLMREEDSERIATQFAETLLPSRRDVEALHCAERLRDALVGAAASTNGPALENALAALRIRFPGAEISRIRHLAQSAAAEKTKGRPPKAARELFRLIKTMDEASSSPPSGQ